MDKSKSHYPIFSGDLPCYSPTTVGNHIGHSDQVTSTANGEIISFIIIALSLCEIIHCCHKSIKQPSLHV